MLTSIVTKVLNNQAAAAAAKSLSVVSDSVRTYRRQPTSLPRPWDSPGKNMEWVAISFSNSGKWKMKVKMKAAQSCLNFSDPMDCSLPGSSVQGIFQARVLEWGAIALSAFKVCCYCC